MVLTNEVTRITQRASVEPREPIVCAVQEATITVFIFPSLVVNLQGEESKP